MITALEAERIATNTLGRSSNDAICSWSLREFKEGWLIEEKNVEGLIGGAHRAIEKATGKVKLFPSSVPPGRIMDEYTGVQDRGRYEEIKESKGN